MVIQTGSLLRKKTIKVVSIIFENSHVHVCVCIYLKKILLFFIFAENGISGSIFIWFLGFTFVIIVAYYKNYIKKKAIQVFLIVTIVSLVYILPLNYQQI